MQTIIIVILLLIIVSISLILEVRESIDHLVEDERDGDTHGPS